MCAAAPPNTARLLGAKPAGHHRGRQHRARPQRGEADRVTRNVDHRTKQIFGQLIESRREVPYRTPPAGAVGSHAGRGLIDRLIQHARGAVIERVRAVDFGPLPHQPVALKVDLLPERRTHAQGVRRRAVVVDDSGHRQLTRARSPADRVASLQHLHIDTVTGKVNRGGQTVGAGTDDNRGRHRALRWVVT
jgi:hypothetical protein